MPDSKKITSKILRRILLLELFNLIKNPTTQARNDRNI